MHRTVAEEKGKHKNGAGQDCPCRRFRVTMRGFRGIPTDTVKCDECQQEFEATETELLKKLHP